MNKIVLFFTGFFLSISAPAFADVPYANDERGHQEFFTQLKSLTVSSDIPSDLVIKTLPNLKEIFLDRTWGEDIEEKMTIEYTVIIFRCIRHISTIFLDEFTNLKKREKISVAGFTALVNFELMLKKLSLDTQTGENILQQIGKFSPQEIKCALAAVLAGGVSPIPGMIECLVAIQEELPLCKSFIDEELKEYGE